jgi:hypothetical protein
MRSGSSSLAEAPVGGDGDRLGVRLGFGRADVAIIAKGEEPVGGLLS